VGRHSIAGFSSDGEIVVNAGENTDFEHGNIVLEAQVLEAQATLSHSR